MTCATTLLGLEPVTVDVEQGRLRAFAGGSGPDVLLLHGLSGGAATWVEVVDRLRPTHRVVALDLPGHGGSAAPPPRADVAWYADAVAAAATALGLRGPVVAGHSFGGQVAARLVERHPHLADGLVLAGPCGVAPLPALTRALGVVTTTVRPGALVAPAGRRLAGRAWFRRLAFGAMLAADAGALPRRGVEGFFCELREHRDIRTARRAIYADGPIAAGGPFPCPAVVLWGDRDAVVPSAHGRALARRTGARLRVVADCGHLLIAERPGALAVVDAVVELGRRTEAGR
jgi:pimeloyl-ACP methyl ester carboxylesterase